MTRDQVFEVIRQAIGSAIEANAQAPDIADVLASHIALVCSLNRVSGATDDDIAATCAAAIEHKLALITDGFWREQRPASGRLN